MKEILKKVLTLGERHMRKEIYNLSRNRIILGNKRSFNYLKEMM